jgi:hypothetical protein
MTLNASIIVLGLAGLLFFISAGRSIRRRRLVRGLLGAMAAIALFLVAAGVLMISTNLGSYQRMNAEQLAGELQFTRLGDRQFNGVFTFPSGERADFALRGDEWQVDARLIKWRAFAGLIGFDAAFRLDRIGGRYTRIEDEQTQSRTVFALHPPERVDVWELLHRHQSWVPWIDASYGTAAFLPMADGASYEIKASQSGLVARPLNLAARTAVGGWHST